MNSQDQTVHEPLCPRCQSAQWLQIIDWSRPLIEEAAATLTGLAAAELKLMPAEVLYVCHACNKTYGHPVPDHWAPDPGWLPEYA